jgi:hypothetical protein
MKTFIECRPHVLGDGEQQRASERQHAHQIKMSAVRNDRKVDIATPPPFLPSLTVSAPIQTRRRGAAYSIFFLGIAYRAADE